MAGYKFASQQEGISSLEAAGFRAVPIPQTAYEVIPADVPAGYPHRGRLHPVPLAVLFDDGSVDLCNGSDLLIAEYHDLIKAVPNLAETL